MFDDKLLAKIAGEYGTPIFVISEKRIIDNYRRIHSAFSKRLTVKVQYAAKANTSLAVLKTLKSLGSGIDAVSYGEIFLCEKAGFGADRILFTGVNTPDKELELVAKSGVTINIDSISQLERLAKICCKHGVSSRIERASTKTPRPKLSFRINPDVGAGHHHKVVTGSAATKFGIAKENALDAYRRAKSLGFDIVGIHAHAGSGIMESDTHVKVTERLCALAKNIEKELGINLDFVDIGGGFGIPYKPGQKPIDIDDFAKRIASKFREFYGKESGKTLLIEPGRYIVADAEVLLTQVNTLKENGGVKFAGVDAGFNDLIRPAFYGSYHHIEPLNVKMTDASQIKAGAKINSAQSPTAKYTIAGPLCETGDVFAEDRELPEIKEGDVLKIHDVGAYGTSMSSRYNSRPLAGEIMIRTNGKAEIIRGAEAFNGLLARQRF